MSKKGNKIMKLIDKDAVVTEIERLKSEYIKHTRNKFCAEWSYGVLDHILSFINTLEVKDMAEGEKLKEEAVAIPKALYDRLNYLGLIPNEVRNHNVGESDYSQHTIQPWSVWLDWKLNAWDADIVKRIARKKSTDPRKKDYEKIIHICQERIRQIDAGGL